ncbi:MAG TPA: PHP-associated domain-containing protein [Anaerolinea sp.]|nr:PHP-associated domain-containing protein [Anaerolinea sp.]
MKVDLHVHASERSGCAIHGEEAMIQAALSCGLNGMAFTDHHRLVEPARLAELNEKYAPFHIYPGIEITADDEDWLVLGAYDLALEREDWHYPQLASFTRSIGGIIILAHPYRYAPRIHVDLKTCPPDGIEGRSNNTPPMREAEIRRMAATLGMAVLSNSDAHSVRAVGSYYNVVPGPLNGTRALLEQLKQVK